MLVVKGTLRSTLQNLIFTKTQKIDKMLYIIDELHRSY